jgi:hypothetical protein
MATQDRLVALTLARHQAQAEVYRGPAEGATPVQVYKPSEPENKAQKLARAIRLPQSGSLCPEARA